MSTSSGHRFAELAELVPGSRLLGDPESRVTRLVHPTEVKGSEDLVLLLARPYLEMGAALPGDKPGIVIGEDLAAEAPDLLSGFPAALVLDRPRLALAYLTPLFPRTTTPPAAIHPTAIVAESAQIGANCAIGPLCVVGENAQLGEGCVLLGQSSIGEGARLGTQCRVHPGARVADGVQIGDRVVLNQNCVVGSDGFSFVTPEANAVEQAKEGRTTSTEKKEQGLLRIDSLGTVILEDDVEVGACSTIDRATLGATIVKRGTKLDNLVQIGHNNTIGSDGLFCAHVGIAGSCTIGDRVVMAGQSGMADGKKIGDDVVVLGRGAVTKDLPSNGVYGGFPAQPAKQELRQNIRVSKIGDMHTELKELQKRIAELEKGS